LRSNLSVVQRIDCFVALLLAMTPEVYEMGSRNPS
jgi:hypothetical protein